MENSFRRYARQTMLPDVGIRGQRRLQESSVLIIGLGGLGCPVSTYLTGAGIGCIGLADPDHVNLHNLHRQTLYGEADIGKPKVQAALSRLSALSSETSFIIYPDGITSDNAVEIIGLYDLIIDCTDNFATRFLINDTCAILRRPWIMGAISEFNGQVAVMNYNDGPDLSSLYDGTGQRASLTSQPAATGGVIGPAPGIIGSIQAAEAFKILTGMEPALAGRLLTINLLTMQTNIFRL